MTNFHSFEEENKLNLKSFLMTLGSYYTISLYFLFSIVDYIFYQNLFVEFIYVRCFVVLSVIGTVNYFKYKKEISYNSVQIISSIPFIFCSWSIYYMLLRISEPHSSYWAGLAIVIAGLSVGFAFSWPFYIMNVALIVLPFFGLQSVYFANDGQITNYVNVIFLLSISVVCVTGRWFYMRLSVQDYEARKQLANEVESRNRIIEQKTQESVRLHALSKQFSPQILDGIRSGNISLNSKIHKSEICSIFIDIKDSTVKVSNLDREQLQKVINMYIEDVMNVFLKYDITIDKFLGDGVMGFSNNPQPQDDYIERVLLAAFEVRDRIMLKQDVYDLLWGSDFEIRIGISSGPASVGFYGSENLIKSYTAIGKVVNLASRVNGSAPPNQIAVTNEIFEKLKQINPKFLHDISISNLLCSALKGFEAEQIGISVIDRSSKVLILDDENCPHGHGPLVLSQTNGIYELKCRQCDFVLADSNESSYLKAS